MRIPLCISPGHDVCAPAADDVHAGGTTAAGPGHAGCRGRVCSRTSHGRNRWACLFVRPSGSVSCWPNCVSNVGFFFICSIASKQNSILFTLPPHHHQITPRPLTLGECTQLQPFSLVAGSLESVYQFMEAYSCFCAADVVLFVTILRALQLRGLGAN